MPDDGAKGDQSSGGTEGGATDDKGGKGDEGKGTEGAGSESGGEWSEDRARATIERQRESERAAKDAQKRAEAELEELRKNLPEQERLQREKAESDAKAEAALETAKKMTLRSEVRALATTLKFRDPSLAIKFVDQSKVEWNGEGEPSGIRTQLESAAKEYPFLIGGTGTGDAGEGGAGGTGGKSMTELIREQAGR